MTITTHTTLEGYLTNCKAASIDDLTRDQLFQWALSGQMGIESQVSYMLATNNQRGNKPTLASVEEGIRKSLNEGKQYTYVMFEDETCDSGRTDKINISL